MRASVYRKNIHQWEQWSRVVAGIAIAAVGLVIGSFTGHLDRMESTEPDPAELAERNELVRSVHDALATLDPVHREILVLRDLEGRSGPDTAATLGLTNDAMKSRLHRARAALRREFARDHSAS